MNRTLTLLGAAVLGVSVLAGCGGAEKPGSRLSGRQDLGGVSAADIEQAKMIQLRLPSHLKLSLAQVSVQPKPGHTLVYISGVSDPAERRRIEEKAAEFQSRATFDGEPVNPIRVQFR